MNPVSKILTVIGTVASAVVIACATADALTAHVATRWVDGIRTEIDGWLEQTADENIGRSPQRSSDADWDEYCESSSWPIEGRT